VRVTSGEWLVIRDLWKFKGSRASGCEASSTRQKANLDIISQN
jgi:hypothetical protein